MMLLQRQQQPILAPLDGGCCLSMTAKKTPYAPVYMCGNVPWIGGGEYAELAHSSKFKPGGLKKMFIQLYGAFREKRENYVKWGASSQFFRFIGTQLSLAKNTKTIMLLQRQHPILAPLDGCCCLFAYPWWQRRTHIHMCTCVEMCHEFPGRWICRARTLIQV